MEQAGDAPFNRGKVNNIGFTIAEDYQWLCFHDVDLVPFANSDYSLPSSPTRLCSATSKYNYEPLDNNNLGGVILFLPHHFREVNGFSNNYWGWGCEDNDLTNRCVMKGLEIATRPVIYKHLLEEHAQGPHHENFEANIRNLHNPNYDGDGLNSLDFKVLSSQAQEGYLHFLVEIGAPDPCA